MLAGTARATDVIEADVCHVHASITAEGIQTADGDWIVELIDPQSLGLIGRAEELHVAGTSGADVIEILAERLEFDDAPNDFLDRECFSFLEAPGNLHVACPFDVQCLLSAASPVLPPADLATETPVVHNGLTWGKLLLDVPALSIGALLLLGVALGGLALHRQRARG